MSLRWRSLAGRILQLKKPVLLTSRTAQWHLTENTTLFASMNENLLDFPPWRKEPRPSSKSSAYAEGSHTPCVARELLGDILMLTFEQIVLVMLGPPPAQRRFREPEMIRDTLNFPPAGLDKPYSFPFELIRETL